ncbi:MAG: hypothetical protein H6867_01835 [Rhodospirillales bacterium]|nr:hypothetical protein [Rhodospirillales bacterium]MCB9997258.1 hypothetical protein [Rhodospirillales bacterium]
MLAARLSIYIFVLFVAFVVQKPASACECMTVSQERGKEIIAAAAFIFEGRIMGLDTMEQPEEDFDYTADIPVSQSPVFSKARLKIIDLYKGVPGQERLEAYIDTLSSCGYMIEIGDVMDFILNEQDGVLVQAEICDMPGQSDWDDLKAGIYRQP